MQRPAGTPLEQRLVAVVDPERGALAALVRSLKDRENEARGLAAVLNGLLREARPTTKYRV